MRSYRAVFGTSHVTTHHEAPATLCSASSDDTRALQSTPNGYGLSGLRSSGGHAKPSKSALYLSVRSYRAVPGIRTISKHRNTPNTLYISVKRRRPSTPVHPYQCVSRLPPEHAKPSKSALYLIVRSYCAVPGIRTISTHHKTPVKLSNTSRDDDVALQFILTTPPITPLL